jgi:hypothetical protein
VTEAEVQIHGDDVWFVRLERLLLGQPPNLPLQRSSPIRRLLPLRCEPCGDFSSVHGDGTGGIARPFHIDSELRRPHRENRA